MERKLPRNIGAEETKNRIITAAEELLQSAAPEQITVNRICEDANITKGAFYYHFSSKDELISLLFLQTMSAYFQAEHMPPRPASEEKQDLLNWVIAHLSLQLKFYRMWNVDVVRMIFLEGLMEKADAYMPENSITPFFGVLERLVQNGFTRKDLNLQQFMSAVIGWIAGINYLATAKRDKYSNDLPDALIRDFMAIYMA